MSWVSLLGDGFCVEATACLSCESCCATAFCLYVGSPFLMCVLLAYWENSLSLSHVGSHTCRSHTQTLYTAAAFLF